MKTAPLKPLILSDDFLIYVYNIRLHYLPAWQEEQRVLNESGDAREESGRSAIGARGVQCNCPLNKQHFTRLKLLVSGL